jgi:hypothetical protein
MNTIKVRKRFGTKVAECEYSIKNSEFLIKTNNPDKFLKNILSSAFYHAHSKNGNIFHTYQDNFLQIYYDIPNCDVLYTDYEVFTTENEVTKCTH